MSDYGFNTAVLGANAYQKRFSSLAYNLAASGAVAGKAKDTFVTAFDLNRNSLQGVQSVDRRFLNEVGSFIPSHERTNFAINGQGFACVKSSLSNGEIFYGRDGTFSQDKDGYLTNNLNQYLCGFLTDPSGKVIGGNQTSQALTPINIKNIRIDGKSSSQITSSLAFDVETTAFNYNTAVYSPLGTQEILTFNWTKAPNDTTFVDSSATQGWILTISSSQSALAEPYASKGVRLELDSHGNILTYVAGTASSGTTVSPVLNITWSNGFSSASPVTGSLTLNFLTPVRFDNNGSDGIGISDGYLPGNLERIEFDKEGYGQVTYSNDQTLPYCRIPLALFNNINGLDEQQPGLFSQTADSGIARLGFPDSDNYGALASGKYEQSTVDAATEYLKMIQNQRDYIMNLKSIEVGKAMIAKLENI